MLGGLQETACRAVRPAVRTVLRHLGATGRGKPRGQACPSSWLETQMGQGTRKGLGKLVLLAHLPLRRPRKCKALGGKRWGGVGWGDSREAPSVNQGLGREGVGWAWGRAGSPQHEPGAGKGVCSCSCSSCSWGRKGTEEPGVLRQEFPSCWCLTVPWPSPVAPVRLKVFTARSWHESRT